MQNFDNRLERLAYILTELSKGSRLSTPYLVEQLEVSKKIIQTDFKEYILPYLEEIHYDYSAKCYIAKNNFLQKTFLDSRTLAMILILKAKSRDKYSPHGLAKGVDDFVSDYQALLDNSIYSKSMVEALDTNKELVIQIENAVKSNCIITCTYNNKIRELYPLEIINLEGFWYLINFDTEYEDIRRYHLKSIKNVEVLEETFEMSPAIQEILDRFDYAINAFFEPLVEPFAVELYVESKVAQYFERKPISKRQRVMQRYEDGSIDLEIFITDYMEIIPTIQRYMPYIGVVSPDGLRDEIQRNIIKYIENIK